MAHAPQITEEIKTTLLHDILRQVSRSFYLTLSIAPLQTRQTLGIAYLFCRAADTMADTALLPAAERLTHLTQFREQFMRPVIQWDRLFALADRLDPAQGSQGERALLSRLSDCFHLFLALPTDDQRLVRELVVTLTNGMAMDLTLFPGDTVETAHAIKTLQETDQYCYYVAGCVGEFWTKLHRQYLPAMRSPLSGPPDEQCRLAVHFGKGLQMTNLLKDIAPDLRRGRCYLPQELLAPVGLTPQQLADPRTLPALRPILFQLMHRTIDHLDQGWAYIRSLPPRPVRLRLACLWPHLLALKTLRLIATSDQLLQPAPLKISRASVYRTMAVTMLFIWSPSLLNRYQIRLRGKLLDVLDS